MLREREKERVSGAYSFASIFELHCYLLLNLTFLSLNLHWLLNRNVSFPLYQSIYPHPESDRKMLDGLLGRSGFYSKCKSLIKQTRTRIDVVRRKRNATQKFLRKDVADLLANGLESNAYGRTEGLIAELILSSCYEFIDHVCEIILKHLPILQKIRECPEDCREAIASLMFAAARFSDLPELRELRDLFQERYGSSLEYYVNQKLVENITPKPPSMEKKVQLMQEIAIEFSIWWDSQGFEERMYNSSATEKNKQQSTVTLHAAENKVLTLEETVQKTVKDEVLAKKKSEATSQNKDTEALDRHHIEMRKEEGAFIRRDDLNHHISRGPKLVTDRYKPTSYREETIQKREEHGISFQSRQPRSEADPLPVNKGINSPPALIHEPTRKREDLVDGPKSNFRSNVIPPYVKPRKAKHKIDDPQDTLTFNPGSNSNRSEKGQAKPDNPNPQVGKIVNSHGNVDGPVRFTEIYYKDAARRSHRRKHSRSTSVGQEEERVVRRVSTSRRKHESRKGLQILCDDDHYKRDDEEESVIDKLLLHYSKKPSSSESGKPKRKTKNGELNGSPPLDDEEHSTPTTSRSFSLPSRHHAPEPEPQRKVFARAASFQQDSTPAKHVHPKLPDYDDLAARFAALRASKD